MSSMVPRAPESWILATVSRLWADVALLKIAPLKGDASARHFWRVSLEADRGAPSSAIAVDLGPDGLPPYVSALGLVSETLPEPPWLNVHRFLMRIGAAVPAIYAADVRNRKLLVEDVGSMPLFQAAERGHGGDLYRLAIDQLLIFHHYGTVELDCSCIAAKIAYDKRLFRWELEQFLETGINEVAPSANRDAIAHELDDLATRLDHFPRVFSHRDYHGHNLFVQEGERGQPKIRVIDFQDALMAPAAQDLAVLLTTRDAARLITPKIERRIVDYYYAALIRQQAPSLRYEELLESYRLCVLQHALKVIGRFIVLEHQGKAGYRHYIPFALEQARRMLNAREFPHLHAVLTS
ncbi:MAG: phosphotransferase [Deltaproteobacteria bacterium]|nr:phosphotransferase [Deltaproteobacteria bacterium]